MKTPKLDNWTIERGVTHKGLFLCTLHAEDALTVEAEQAQRNDQLQGRNALLLRFLIFASPQRVGNFSNIKREP